MTDEESLVADLKAIDALLISLLAMHMTPENLEKGAAALRMLADQQERMEASGVAVHPSNKVHDPATLQAIARRYDAARADALAKLAQVETPRPGHPAPGAT